MFDIRQRGSTVGREVLGGVTTFVAMSYILFLQPAVLGATGMDRGGVFMATCIASGLACILMGVLANYPIALARRRRRSLQDSIPCIEDRAVLQNLQGPPHPRLPVDTPCDRASSWGVPGLVNAVEGRTSMLRLCRCHSNLSATFSGRLHSQLLGH